MFKFSKKLLSLILAILMLTMTAIGVNAHELSEEDIVSIEIMDDVTVDELSEVSEATEVVVSSTSEMEPSSNISENELEADEEELRPKKASRSITTCASAMGYSGANYSITTYSTGLTLLCADLGSIQKDYNPHADEFLLKINEMQSIYENLTISQKEIWLVARGVEEITGLISDITTILSGAPHAQIIDKISDIASYLQDIATQLGYLLGNLEAESLAYTFTAWSRTEDSAIDAYYDFISY